MSESYFKPRDSRLQVNPSTGQGDFSLSAHMSTITGVWVGESKRGLVRLGFSTTSPALSGKPEYSGVTVELDIDAAAELVGKIEALGI